MRRKFIVTLENRSHFRLDEFGDLKIDDESTITYHPMASYAR